jgi:hypothetical protein
MWKEEPMMDGERKDVLKMTIKKSDLLFSMKLVYFL